MSARCAASSRRGLSQQHLQQLGSGLAGQNHICLQVGGRRIRRWSEPPLSHTRYHSSADQTILELFGQIGQRLRAGRSWAGRCRLVGAAGVGTELAAEQGKGTQSRGKVFGR
jgi:hypothetical protein